MRTLFVLLSVSLLAAQNPQGALSGKEIVISPGHGYYWHSSLGWTTQRGLIDGLIEDIHTHEIIHDHLLPWLEGMGARVIMCRSRSRTTEEHILQNDMGAPTYVESGPWFTNGSSGWAGSTYRYANTSSTGGATATYRTTIGTTDVYPVYVAYRAGANRTSSAKVLVTHAGGSSWRTIDQTRFDLRWVHVGDFPFRAGEDAIVELQSESAAAGVIIADAVKIGDGYGNISRGGSTSGQLKWRECSRYHAQAFGAPSTVWNSVSSGQDNADDVTCRPRYGEWYAGGQADLFLSLHTNAGGGSGTSSFIYNGGATAGSATWQNTLHTRLISDIQTYWDPTWIDRGQQAANFGEIRELNTMPGVLVELAFHDDIGGDIEDLHHPRFRAISGRAMARAILNYLAPGQPWTLDPPTALAMRNVGVGGTLYLSWNAISGATGYRVCTSKDGFAYDEGTTVTGTSHLLTNIAPGEMVYAKVAALNASGAGINSEPVGARHAPSGKAPLLIVNGFDRFDRQVKEYENPKDWIRVQGTAAIAIQDAGYHFDGCTNEAIANLLFPFVGYDCVGWFLGEESTVDETFSFTEQLRVNYLLSTGANLFFSGAEVGWDLDQQGSPVDRTFYEQTLGQDYVADDANTYTLLATNTGPLGPLPAMVFDNGTNGIYDVDYPDVIQPMAGSGGQIVMTYATGGGAAVLKGDGKVLGMGFPIESIVSPVHRQLLMERVLHLMCTPTVSPTSTPTIGSSTPFQVSFPSSPNQTYLAAAALSNDPGILLPDTRTIPLALDPLLIFSTMPQPVFTGMTGTLDSQGLGTLTVNTPNDPGLSGFQFFLSAITLSGTTIQDIGTWTRITL